MVFWVTPLAGFEVPTYGRISGVHRGSGHSEHLPAHLLVGSDAVEYAGQAEATRAQEAERWRDFSVSTDVETTRPLPDIRF